MHYKHGAVRRQSTENQVCISLLLQRDIFSKKIKYSNKNAHDIFFNDSSKKVLLFKETLLYFDIIISWLGGKNYIVRNYKWIACLKSRYINSNPAVKWKGLVFLF